MWCALCAPSSGRRTASSAWRSSSPSTRPGSLTMLTAGCRWPCALLRPPRSSAWSPAPITWLLALWTVAIVAAFALDWRTGVVIVGYIALMNAYTYYLKFEVILDVMVIAAGFVLRAMAGAYAVDVPISPWLYVVTALGALFIAVTKRRAEVTLLAGAAPEHRSTLLLYTPALLDQMTSMVTASTIIAYALYTFTATNVPANHTMMLTIPFVAYGIFRYLFLALTRDEGGSPEEVLLKDVPLILTVVGWVATSMIVLAAYG